MANSELINRFEGYLSADPSNIGIIKKLNDLYLESKMFTASKNLLEGALSTINVYDASLEYDLAFTYMSLQKFGDAGLLLDKLAKTGIRNTSIQYNRAYCEVMSERYLNGAEILKSIRDTEEVIPVYVDKLYVRALHHLGRLNDAYDLSTSILAGVDEADPDALGVHSLLCLDLNKFEEARECCIRISKITSTHPTAHCVFGFLFLNDAQIEEAQSCFKTALALSPNDGRSWLGQGLSSMLEGNIGDANYQLSEASKLMPDHLGTLNVYAWSCIFSKDLAQAEEAVRKALSLDRNFAESHGTLAVIQALTGRETDSKKSALKAVKLNSTSFSAMYANLLLMDGNADINVMQKKLDSLLKKPFNSNGKSVNDFMASFFRSRV